jgi:hypothetical protein
VKVNGAWVSVPPGKILKQSAPDPWISRLRSFQIRRASRSSLLCRCPARDVTVDNLTITYHGKQRFTTDNNGRFVYGGSDLVCVRGGWGALDRLPIANETRFGVAEAKLYDGAMHEYAGFMASRRNYDVGQELTRRGADGRPCSNPRGDWRGHQRGNNGTSGVPARSFSAGCRSVSRGRIL